MRLIDYFDTSAQRYPAKTAFVQPDGSRLTYAEAAELLGMPEGTVMSRLHRARKRIRTRLAAAGLAPKRGVM